MSYSSNSDAEFTSNPFSKLTSFERRVLARSAVFKQLLEVKSAYRRHPDVDRQFTERRRHQLSTHDAPNYAYRIGYEKVLQHISSELGGCFEHNRVLRFLDLGFSPGGFSNCLLDRNPDAFGIGITLPDDDAPFRFDPEGTLLQPPRYCTIFDNILTLPIRALNPLAGLTTSTTIKHPIAEPYDLVIAGAFPTLESYVPWYHRVQLVLSQVLIAFTNLRPGGSCIIITNHKPFRWLVELVSILRVSFRTIQAFKGSQGHEIRSSGYMVCQDFFATQDEVNKTIDSLRGALHTLAMTSENRHSQNDNDDGFHNERSAPLLKTLSDEELIEQELDAFLQIVEPRWAGQMQAIRDDISQRANREPATAPTTAVINTTRPNGFPWTERVPPPSLLTNALSANDPPPSPPSSPTFRRWAPPQRRGSVNAASPAATSSNWRTGRAPEEAESPEEERYVANPVFSPGYRSGGAPDARKSWRRGG